MERLEAIVGRLVPGGTAPPGLPKAKTSPLDRAAVIGFLKRAALIALAGCYLLLAARSVVNTNYEYGKPMLALALAFGPLAFYFALRAPAIFPLGAYVALIPFDALLRVSGGVTITRLIGIATIVALCLRMVLSRRILVPQGAYWAWLAWIAWTAVTFEWTPDPHGGYSYFTQIFSLFIMMTILAVYPFRRFEFNFMLVVIVLTGALEGLYAVWERNSGLFDGARLSVGEASGLVIDQNYFAGSFILPAALALATVFFSRSRKLRVAALVTLPPMLAAIFLSGSRSGFISLVLLCFYLALRSRHRIAALLVTAGMFVLSTLTPIWNRFLNDPTAANGAGRTDIWVTGLASLRDHWLFGAGVGSFLTVYNQNLLKSFQVDFQHWDRPPHSLVVGVVTETGVIGLFLVLTAWYLTFRQSRFVPVTSDFYIVRLALEATTLALFIDAQFIDPVYIKYMWLACSLPLALVNVVALTTARSAAVSGLRPRGRPVRADALHT